MPEYSILTGAALMGVVLLELAWLRTGIFCRPTYWISTIIVLGFQVLVDGWLTRLEDPVVLYDSAVTTGLRFPWDIPIEDFGFGAAMVTLTMMLWLRAGREHRADEHGHAEDGSMRG